jgi:hypothetical protein
VNKTIVVCFLLFVAGSIFAPHTSFAQTPQLYIGGRAGLGPIFGPDGTVLGGNLNPLQIDWQIIKFLAIGTGIGFYFAPVTKYTAPKQTDLGSGIMETYSGMETHMVFPLLLKATHRPGIFLFEIGGGLYVAPVLMNTTVERTNDNGYTVGEGYGKNLFSVDHNSPFGFIASGCFGVKAGKGIIFLDLSYLRDFSEITVNFKDVKLGHHLWNMLAFNIGYKHGLLSK